MSGPSENWGITMSKRILIVEDNYDVRMLLSHIVEEFTPYHCTLVKDGLDAWVKAQHEQFDLLVLDLHLPNMQGWDLIKRLRLTEQYVRTPIIAVTAQDHYFARGSTQSAGCDLYLTKPVDIDRLLTAISHYMNPVVTIF